MFLFKKITAMLKNSLKGRGVLHQWIFYGSLLVVVWYVWNCLDVPDPDDVPRNMRKYLWYPEGYVMPRAAMTDDEIEDLNRKLEQLNRNPEVRNSEKYGAVTANATVIAVQVHRDAERLQHLIVSLGQVHLIQQVLLVFSHSFYDEDLNALIKSIRYCKVMQIFYPYSLQLHPESFPGMDPSDGFNRDARRSEYKQHWWWKANFIFNLTPKSPKRVVIFLEENDYVLPDFLYILRYLRRMQVYFPMAEVMALGQPYSEGQDYDAILLDSWSPKYDRGLGFNSSTWQKITKNASYFCKYDDCSWSYSLAHLFGSFPNGVVDVVTCLSPRVVSMSGFRSGAAAGRWARALARRVPLFPSTLRAVVLVMSAGGRARHEAPAHAPGGWGDTRDQKLCLDIVETNMSWPKARYSFII